MRALGGRRGTLVCGDTALGGACDSDAGSCSAAPPDVDSRRDGVAGGSAAEASEGTPNDDLADPVPAAAAAAAAAAASMADALEADPAFGVAKAATDLEKAGGSAA